MAIGCYLCYTAEDFGHVYEQWSASESEHPPHAILYVQSDNAHACHGDQGKRKFTLGKHADHQNRFYELVVRFLRYRLNHKLHNVNNDNDDESVSVSDPTSANSGNSTTLVRLLKHAAVAPLLLAFMLSGGEIFFLKESGKGILFEALSVVAVAAVSYNNTELLPTALAGGGSNAYSEIPKFLAKCREKGAAEKLLRD